MLDDICENLDELVIVANGFLNEESVFRLSKYTDNDIIFRDNVGFDAGAWRDAIMDFGFNKISEFDELVLFNDSFFGPIYPFKVMFNKMDDEDVDFWGITSHGEAPNSKNLCPYGYRPRYLLTYFMAFRKNIMQSKEFKKYWISLPDYKTPTDLLFKHEAVLTKKFADLGYKWEAYVDSEDLEETRNKAMNIYAYDMYNLVVNRNLPVLKRKTFKVSRDIHLRYNMASDLSNTIKYLEENTDYDTSLIYRYLLRTMEPGQLVNILNLVKIIPKYQPSLYSSDKKVLLIVHLFFDEYWEYAFDYLKNVPKDIDILITTDSYDKKEFFEEKIGDILENLVNVVKIENRGREMASLLIASQDILKDYDYFCFMHDFNYREKEYITVGATYRDILWENNLASPDYINEIIREFDTHSSLGLIVPPMAYHGSYFKEYVNDFWGNDFNQTSGILDQMGIFSKINRKSPPLSADNCFWARYDALEPLFNLYLGYEDFPEEPMPNEATIYHALDKVYPYVAAFNGYYTEIVMTDDYFKSELSNHSYMFTNTINNLKSQSSRYFTFNRGFYGFVRSIRNGFNRIKRDIR